MINPFCDKYFSKSKEVARVAGLNPIVKYRVFTRFAGIAALEPMAKLIMKLADNVKVEVLATGTPFVPGDTIAIITGRFQDVVETETQFLQWAALPCYCAYQSKEIIKAAEDKIVIDFHARHLFGAESVALASYGASIGGIRAASTDAGSNAEAFLEHTIDSIVHWTKSPPMIFHKPGIGTTPHAILAIFKGNYEAMAEAYRKAFPLDLFIALIDYNNREIDDSLLLLNKYGKHLAGVRIDTCGENYAQIGSDVDGTPLFSDKKGVSIQAVLSLKTILEKNNGEHVKLFVSSGFNADKVDYFMNAGDSFFDGIGTGSFIPKVPTATADIFEVDGKPESKKGREWGAEKNLEFYKKGITTFGKEK